MEPSETITCVDCGGTAHLLQPPTEDDLPPVPGDLSSARASTPRPALGASGARSGPLAPAGRSGRLLVYRCADCLDRWDVIVPDQPPR